MGRIVVGIDGSEASDAALGWALDQARRTGDDVQVVHVWHYPEIAELLTANPFELQHDELQAEAAEQLRRAVDRVGVPPDVRIDPVLAMGRAAEVLLRSAADAELLVVGSRGRGGFAGLLLGSVSHHCVQHAPCPVVVVPPAAGR